MRTAADRWPRAASGSSGSAAKRRSLRFTTCALRLSQGTQCSSRKGLANGLRRPGDLRLALLRLAGMHTMHDEGVEPSYWLLKRGHGRTGRGLVFSLASCIRLHGIGARGHRRFHCVFVACAYVCVCVCACGIDFCACLESSSGARYTHTHSPTLHPIKVSIVPCIRKTDSDDASEASTDARPSTYSHPVSWCFEIGLFFDSVNRHKDCESEEQVDTSPEDGKDGWRKLLGRLLLKDGCDDTSVGLLVCKPAGHVSATLRKRQNCGPPPCLVKRQLRNKALEHWPWPR